MLSSYIKLHDFRVIPPLRVDSGEQLIHIPLQKHCVALSDHITVGIRSHTLVTQGGYSIFDSYSCSPLPGTLLYKHV